MKLFFKEQQPPDRTAARRSAVTRDRTISIKNESLQTFCTNSKYEGTWDSIGIRGYGSYYLFYGVDYDGDFWDSMCNERGTLMYPNEAKMDGIWENGHMIAHRYFFADNLCYGPYCEMPDRRFYLEMKDSLKPAGRSFLRNSYIIREIPPGCYDAGDGFYDPKMKCVYDPRVPNKIVRIPNKDQHEWIIKHCRKAWDEPVGYDPSIYENWNLEDQDYGNEVGKDYRKRLMRKSIDYLCFRKKKLSTTRT